MPYNRSELIKLVRAQRREDLEDFTVAVVEALWPVDANRDEQWNGGDVCEEVAQAIDVISLCPYAGNNAQKLGACEELSCEPCAGEGMVVLLEIPGATARCGRCGAKYRREPNGEAMRLP